MRFGWRSAVCSDSHAPLPLPLFTSSIWWWSVSVSIWRDSFFRDDTHTRAHAAGKEGGFDPITKSNWKTHVVSFPVKGKEREREREREREKERLPAERAQSAEVTGRGWMKKMKSRYGLKLMQNGVVLIFFFFHFVSFRLALEEGCRRRCRNWRWPRLLLLPAGAAAGSASPAIANLTRFKCHANQFRERGREGGSWREMEGGGGRNKNKFQSTLFYISWKRWRISFHAYLNFLLGNFIYHSVRIAWFAIQILALPFEISIHWNQQKKKHSNEFTNKCILTFSETYLWNWMGIQTRSLGLFPASMAVDVLAGDRSVYGIWIN